MSIESGVPRAFVSFDEVMPRPGPAVGTAVTPLRDSHIVLLAVESVAALYTRMREWRDRRATERALAELDDYQLSDVGFAREDGLYRRLEQQ